MTWRFSILILVATLWAGDAQGQVISRNVEPVGQAVGALHTGWYNLAPMRQVDAGRLGKTLADIESRMPAGHIYADNDLITWAHETTHGINSRCRQALPGVNCFYCLNGYVGVFREPRLRKSTVCRYVPANLRGDVWTLYMTGQQAWDDTPTYILDEWVAYINGATAGQELYPDGNANGRSLAADVRHAVEFSGYASALLRAIDANDPSYPDRDKLAYFVGWNIDRTLALAKAGEHRPQIERFAVAYFQGGYQGACPNGQCGQPQWNSGWWNRPPQQPAQQPPSAPVATPPQIVKVPTAPATVGARGPAGPKGERGETGPAGPPGEDGRDATVDVQAIVDAAVLNAIAELKKIPFDAQLTDTKGRVTSTKVYLGGKDPTGKPNALKIKLDPTTIPVVTK